MKTIYKYEVPVSGKFNLRLPKGAVILSFQSQRFALVLWAMVNTDAVGEDRNFRLFRTGHPIGKIPNNVKLRYIGTTHQSQEPSLMWHLFEEVKKCST